MNKRLITTALLCLSLLPGCEVEADKASVKFNTVALPEGEHFKISIGDNGGIHIMYLIKDTEKPEVIYFSKEEFETKVKFQPNTIGINKLTYTSEDDTYLITYHMDR